MGGLHITGRIYDRICTSSWSSRVHLDGSGGSIYVNLFPVDLINEHEGARRPEPSRLCGDGKVRDFLPGVESVPHFLTAFGGAEEVPSRAEVLGDGTIGREEALGVPR
jgi:hypothetical protein